jgi:PAS domain S-box-containing protein
VAQLRSQAEQRAQAMESPEVDTLWPAEARRVLHELRVHQIELEMQNEELRATQAQLEAAKMRYFALYDLAPVGYLTLSEAGLIQEANLTAAVAFGVERKTLPGQRLSRFILSDDQDLYYKHFDTLFKSGKPQSCELRFTKKDDVPFWVRLESAVVADEAGSMVWRMIVSDIAERKRAEEGLRVSEERLKYAERLAHLGHWHWDVRTNQLSLSEEVFRILGQPLDCMPSLEALVQAIVPPDRALARGAIRDCLAERSGGSIELRITTHKGDVRAVTCIFEVSLDKEGLPARVFGSCQDVTEARRVQEDLMARQRLESVGTLASGIAHDFNNLLGGVVAQADLALEEYRGGLSPEPELKCIRDAALRGSAIVRQLMIYAGKESEVVSPVDVSSIAREMVELLRVSVSKHAALEIDLGQDLPAVRGSAGQIQQIVLNLVTNASESLEYRDGVIRVTTRRVNVGRAKAVSNGVPEGNYLQLEVADTGCGMSLETQARVFDPFFTTKAAGHGLGLAVVQGIVRALGGTIHLTSELGKGTTFQILLPCDKAMLGATEPAPYTEEPRSSPAATILVVEDEDTLRVAISKLLRKKGLDILEAANGDSAIDLLRASDRRIDAMLLDMSLPGRSSREVVNVAGEARPNMKVVLTSAYPEETVRTAVGATQTCSFVRKPFQLEVLLQTLQSVLRL